VLVDVERRIRVERVAMALDRLAHAPRMRGEQEAGEMHPVRGEAELAADRLPVIATAGLLRWRRSLAAAQQRRRQTQCQEIPSVEVLARHTPEA
jgi:hypothetical protein